MNPLFFKEVNGYFDPARARLSLSCGRPVSIVAGVETGQLVGSLKTLEGVGKYAGDCGARSMMISNYLLEAPGPGQRCPVRGRLVGRVPVGFAGDGHGSGNPYLRLVLGTLGPSRFARWLSV